MRICDIVGCERKSIARGWCNRHYLRWLKHGDPLAGGTCYTDPEESFLARTEPLCWSDCIIWTGATNGDGYGQLWSGGRKVQAHRYSWERANGPIPDGMLIDHTCHVRSCVNVKHLRIATPAQNSAHLSGARKGRSLPRGVTPSGNGYRAQVTINGRAINAGTFPTIERAEIAAKNCRAFYFREYAGN